MKDKSEKLPSLQFYVGDWRKDPGVQALSYHDRGVWFEILCLMFESEERGRLLLNGKPMPDEALARTLGLDKQVLNRTLTTLLDYGVASRDEQGALISRRMIRDEEIRQIRISSGKLGGNPQLKAKKENLVNQNSNQNPTTPVNQNPTPSSSSSNSKDNIHPPARASGNNLDVEKFLDEERRKQEFQTIQWLKVQKKTSELHNEGEWRNLFKKLEKEGISLQEFQDFYKYLDEQAWVDIVAPPLMRSQIETWKKRDQIANKKQKQKEENVKPTNPKRTDRGGNNRPQAASRSAEERWTRKEQI